MKAQIRLFLAAGFLAASAVAQQPPLIDRELLFGDPEISAAEISPDGKYIAFLKPLNKTRNIWVKKTDEPFDGAPDYKRHQAAHPRVPLEPGRQIHTLCAGPGRR